MGRITPSFRQIFLQFIKELKFRNNHFYKALKDPEYQKAFDQLLKEAWSAEGAAMSQSGIHCITDILNLMANVHNRKCIEEVRNRLKELERCIKVLTE